MLDNTKEIAQAIFSKPPGEVNSINLSLEEETSYLAEECGINKFITNILRIITMYGINILYGHVDLMSLTDDQILLIKQYTRSYGYNLIINENENVILITFKKTRI